MIIRDQALGEVEVNVIIERSAVDSYIDYAFSLTLDRDLTDEELDGINSKYVGEIQEYAYENGSRDHN